MHACSLDELRISADAPTLLHLDMSTLWGATRALTLALTGPPLTHSSAGAAAFLDVGAAPSPDANPSLAFSRLLCALGEAPALRRLSVSSGACAFAAFYSSAAGFAGVSQCLCCR